MTSFFWVRSHTFFISTISSDESRISLLPERSSVCQCRPEISAIILKKQSRACLLLAHLVLYIVKTQKNVLYILKTTISKSTKKRYTLRSATWTSPKVSQAMQLELTPPPFSARQEVKYHNTNVANYLKALHKGKLIIQNIAVVRVKFYRSEYVNYVTGLVCC